MDDIDGAKSMAKTLRKALAERDMDLPHAACLDIVARQSGVPDWNVYVATRAGGIACAASLFVEHGREADAADFYRAVFAATTLRTYPVDGRVMAIEMRIGGLRIAIAGANPRRMADPALGGPFHPLARGAVTSVLRLAVRDLAALFGRAIAHGAVVRNPPGEDGDGGISGDFFDPFGHIWVVSEPRRAPAPRAREKRRQHGAAISRANQGPTPR